MGIQADKIQTINNLFSNLQQEGSQILLNIMTVFVSALLAQNLTDFQSLNLSNKAPLVGFSCKFNDI